MSDTSQQDLDLKTLTADSDLSGLLERVSFSAGVMVGAEALSAEQDYHRRRLNRHQRWLVGSGTVFGLAVDAGAGAARPDARIDVTLTVAPGFALEGLGRELAVPEPYVSSLVDWLEGQRAADPASLESAF